MPTGSASGSLISNNRAARWPGTFAEYPPPMQRLLRFAGLDPEHALVRWGNFDRTVLLPSTVFEPDETGRSYRFRPNMRSIWVRNFPVKGPVKAYFQVPDTPELAELVEGTGAQIVDGSTQTTNSWGLRGPEPDLTATWRGIVLGDSYMQGLFVGDDETPAECLKRDLKERLEAPVEILNTGHLGYSPEQYYYSLLEYAKRFPPQFVVVSLFANDFGEFRKCSRAGETGRRGATGWARSGSSASLAERLASSFRPPGSTRSRARRWPGIIPGKISNILEATGARVSRPDRRVRQRSARRVINKADRMGMPSTRNPLFNGRIGDGHFSPQGCELWAAAVGRRIGPLDRQRQAAERGPKAGPSTTRSTSLPSTGGRFDSPAAWIADPHDSAANGRPRR